MTKVSFSEAFQTIENIRDRGIQDYPQHWPLDTPV